MPRKGKGLSKSHSPLCPCLDPEETNATTPLIPFVIAGHMAPLAAEGLE